MQFPAAVYDATSYYGGAAFSGVSARLHNPNICRSLSKQFNDYRQKHLHLHAETQLFVLPFDVQLISAHFLMEIAHDNYFRVSKFMYIPVSVVY